MKKGIKFSVVKRDDSKMADLPEVAAGGRGDLARESVRPADCAAGREAWDAMCSKWPDSPPHEADRKKAAAE